MIWPIKQVKEQYGNKELWEFSDEELISLLNSNQSVPLVAIGAICSEILRRMNQIKPLLKD